MNIKKLLLLFSALLICASFISCEADFPIIDNPSRQDTVEHEGVLYAPSREGNTMRAVGYISGRTEYQIAAEINGKKVVSVGASAFYNAEKIEKITIAEGITRIENYAFDNCYALKEVNFPSSIESIGFFAFSDCTSLTELVLPENLREIEESAFLRCTSLKKLFVNSKLETIGKDAFASCGILDEFHIEDAAAWCSVELQSYSENPMTFSKNVYSGGESITELNISGVEEIKNYTFYKLSTLEKLTVGDGVKKIGGSAFSSCEKLLSLFISDSVETISTSAFNSCESLQYVDIGEGVKYFAGLAFYGCTDIRVLNIKNLAKWCEVYFYTEPTGTSNPMRYAKEIRVAGAPMSELVIPEGVTKISKLAFISLKSPSVTIPSSVKEIEETAFYEVDVDVVIYQGTLADWNKITLGQNNFSQQTKLRTWKSSY